MVEVEQVGSLNFEMEKKTDSFLGTRKANLKRSFKLSVHSLLTSCSREVTCVSV